LGIHSSPSDSVVAADVSFSEDDIVGLVASLDSRTMTACTDDIRGQNKASYVTNMMKFLHGLFPVLVITPTTHYPRC
jgi:hypothetical protein